MSKGGSSKPQFAYWKIRGLAQPVRMLLSYAGVEFEDVMYEQGEGPEFSRTCWTDVKDTLGLDFPNLPYYIDGDIKITQSNAILRVIARKYGLYGSGEKEMANIEMILETAMDFRNGVVRMVYNPNYTSLLDEYKKDKGQMSKNLAGFDKYLQGKTFFSGGDKPTVADFPMYELLDQHRMMVPGCLDSYKNITDFMNRFAALPKIKEFLASTKAKLPVNNKVAQFK